MTESALDLEAGGRWFGLPLDAAREVSRVPAVVSRIPRAAPPIRGAINLRGRVVALVELSGLVGLPPAPHDPDLARVVLLEGSAVAFLVEEVLGISSREEVEGRQLLSSEWILERVAKLLQGGSGAMLELATLEGEEPWRRGF